MSNRVVLPDPRNPVMIVIGIGAGGVAILLLMEGWLFGGVRIVCLAG